ncbi:MAG TPA: nucleotidyltransferase domain-containing protein [Longimicrobiaceae bacterium]|nr:nucleotidyltransferase domain-containing protein [Longimicrobiaceae bacterium]
MADASHGIADDSHGAADDDRSIDRSTLDIRVYLSPAELAAADETVRRVRERVPAELAFALLFGSRARRQARPDSDVDILLIFRRLTWDREPQAGMAEEIAAGVEHETGIPVATWTVSLPDLERGWRTPMLVDALEDGIPLWPFGTRPPRIAFTPEDASYCAAQLLDRVGEGSGEVARLIRAGDVDAALRRARDDLARLCTAALLLRGWTRPRRGDAIACVRRDGGGLGGRMDDGVLAWAAESYGPGGKDDARPLLPPPGGLRAVAREVDRLWRAVARRRGAMERWMETAHRR